MQVEIEKTQDPNETESARLRIHQLTPTIQSAVDLLSHHQEFFVAENIQSGASEKMSLGEVLYAEYLERKIFLYTQAATYSLKVSLTKFIAECPPNFIQISKSVVLNLLAVTAFSGTTSGNLLVTVVSGEKIIVNRRYVKSLKAALAKFANTNRM